MSSPIILAGPTGTELARRGVDLAGPAWSARAIDEAPAVLETIHREYAHAGAAVHVACTFRAQPKHFPKTFRELVARAVAIARAAARPGQMVAGSLAPIEDCYRPDLSPAADPDRRELCRRLHAMMAEALLAAGVDLIVCETFPHAGEAMIAVTQAVKAAKTAAAAKAADQPSTPVWLSLTGGPAGDLMPPSQLAAAAAYGAKSGASAVLVNCVAAGRTLEYVAALAAEPLVLEQGARVGAYANAGETADDLALAADPAAARAYAQLAREWVAAGATVVGSCCGTSPLHTAELVRAFAPA